jgi:uncharacterized protein YbbK (DUF523 family)
MNKQNYPHTVVSACLAGLNCRYDCQNKEKIDIIEMVKRGEAIAVCPEQMGGLATPRPAAEMVGEMIITNQGIDVTNQYENGAQEALKLVRLYGINKAILKSHSPMCGVHKVYDGSFSGELKAGSGVFAQLLSQNGFELIEQE